jgi:GNAT superfamily N-acetyltransferase
MGRDPDKSAWHVAEDDTGNILGFQFLEPHPDLPPEACDIASFVRLGKTGLGVGSKLFEASRLAAKSLGYQWINATIRADNGGGLAYYQSRGFEDYAHHPQQRLGNGALVDKVSKRYDLT